MLTGWFKQWTWRRAALSAAAVAVVAGGGLGATVLAGQAAAAPAPVKQLAALASNEDQPKKGWLGLMIAQLNAELAGRLGISQTTGVVVVNVLKSSPAEKAGVQQKDVLQKVGGKDVTDVKAARDAIAAVKPGESVVLTVLRNGQSQAVTVTADDAPVPPRGPRGPRTGQPLPPMPPLPGLGGLPGLKELEGIAPDQMFSHMQGGTMTFTDKDNKPVTVTVTLGAVTAVDTTASTVTVKPNSGTAPVTYTVTANTTIRGRVRELVQLKADDKVTVITVNNATEARLIMGVPEPPKGRGEGRNQSQRFRGPDLGPRGPMGGPGIAMPPVFEGLRDRLQFMWAAPAEDFDSEEIIGS